MLTINKINSIRNINLIYFYSTNTIFNKKNHKYIGVKLVYNNSFVLNENYKDPLFGTLIKKIIERYNIENDTSKIILLGDFTKQLIKENKLEFIEKENKKEQINYYKWENKSFNKYKPYILEVINQVFKEILKINSFSINDLTGYNKSYILDYSIVGLNNRLKVVIYEKDGFIYYKTGIVENTNNSIEGKISQKENKVISYYSYGQFNGRNEYDALKKEVQKQIKYQDNLYYTSNYCEPLVEKDKELLINYLHLEEFEHTLKINEHTYLTFHPNVNSNNGDILFNNELVFLNTDKDYIRIIKCKQEGFSKYEGIVNVTLDEWEDEISIHKLKYDKSIFLIKEQKEKNNYHYSFKEIKEDINLNNRIDLNQFEEIDIHYIEDINQYRKR